MQTRHPALAARAPRLHPLADPHLLLRQQLVGTGADHRLLRQLLLLLLLVQRKVARIAAQQSPVQLHDARTHRIQKGPVVADRHHAALEPVQQILQPQNRIHIQMVGRLVQQQHIRPRHQRLCQRYPLARPAGQRTHLRIAWQMQSLQRLFHPLLPGPPIQGFDAALKRIQGMRVRGLQILLAQCDHFGQARARRFKYSMRSVQHRLLRYISDANALLHLQLAIIRMLQPSQNAQQRRLPGAIASDQSHPLAILQRKLRAIQQRHMAKRQVCIQ